ncbi:MAG: site-2 protease family protein [Candidatus Methanoperedens sp.]|nr:site-2 protease family protein [Candidatus Methanoperedens sp.]MCZ7395971.1 site-2 protease family protein [Candidatus Methanoperedens sp.]
MNYTNLFLFIFLLYWLLVMFLDRRGILGRYNITAYGPVLMLRTTKGQAFLDRLAVHKRFWRLFANIGLPAMLIGMLVMFLLILFIDYSLIRSFQTQTVPAPSRFNEPRNIFLIPGINEYIPFYWGIIALIVTLVVHEFSHAILCKVEGIKVKSMGILLAIIPIGGFAEPDDEQLLGKKEEKSETEKQEAAGEAEPKKLASRSERIRVLTAGVMANFVTALIAFILFFSLLGSLSPLGDVMVTSVVPGYPAQLAGVQQNMILTGINDIQVNNANDFLSYARTLKPGSNVTLHVVESGVRRKISMVATGSNETRGGVNVSQVIEGSPAQKAGIQAGMILVRIDNTEIKVLDDFINFMNSTTQGQKVDVYLLSNSSVNASTVVFRNIELSKYPQVSVNKGFLGVSYSPEEGAVSYSIGMGIGQFRAKDYLNMLKSIPSMMTGLTGWVLLFGLPIFGLGGEGFPGFSGLLTSFYEPTGWAALLGMGTFWILNILLWVGWMNFYAGLFNCLPAVPLDGGHVFRDVMTSSLSRIIGNGEKVEKLSSAIAVLFAVLILMSLVFVIIAPYAAHGF